jgi:hypothetical protein
MSIVDAVIAEALSIQNRPLSQERAKELATELAALLEASRALGAQLDFDDQASDFAQVLLDTRAASGSGS